MNRVDWRTVSLESVGFGFEEVRDQLLPVLRSTVVRGDRELRNWANRMVADCRRGLSRLLPFTIEERRFLDGVLDLGEVRPELLTSDSELARRIADQPMLAWKARNVRRHFGR
jgi:hypothetical protein